MDAKSKLKRAWEAEKHLKQIGDRIIDLRTRSTSITKEVSDMPGSPNRNIQGFTTLVEQIMDEEDRYIRQMSEISEYRKEAHEMIQALPDPAHQMVLELRYIDCKSFQEIADEMGYEMRSVQRLHDVAINILNLT